MIRIIIGERPQLVLERRVHPEDKVEQAYLDRREMQYLYQDSDGYVFMDTESYDQVTLERDLVLIPGTLDWL